jgi:hypothetical protein
VQYRPTLAGSNAVRAGKLVAILALGAWGLSCGSPGSDGVDAMGEPDEDGDGVTVSQGDCDDHDRFVYPGAPDPCDGEDQNCDGVADEDFDLDGDHWSSCAGDCRDTDPTSYPGAAEVADGVDNDCDDEADDGTEAHDDDGDGYAEDQGDCNDDPLQGGALISPGAVEVQLDAEGEPEGFDNDCDDLIDEPLEPCPTGLPETDPMAFAAAFDACLFVTGAGWRDEYHIDPRSRGVFADYGDTYAPRVGPDFFVLSSGVAGDASDPGFVALDSGTAFTVTAPHPDPQGPMGCSSADSGVINDYSEVTFQLKVPANANAFSFDFTFMSAEFPEYVCTSFDDTFLAVLESQAFSGNVSFDSLGNRVSINVGFFDVCDPTLDAACTGDADLVGTGYEGLEGGGTGWLTTTAPVVPNEKITLSLSVFDEGDHILDSAVILDNFRWELEPVDGPITVPREQARRPRFARGIAPVAR